ncbi:FusB/FusC family EF-G-binding protein [Heyndrickxia sporothermodurans]
MDPFIRSDQFNFIKRQTDILINGHSTVNEINVLNALKLLAKEKVFNLFGEMSEEQQQIIEPIVGVEDRDGADKYLLQLRPYVIPFKEVTEQTLKKLFPKVKKLKVPKLDKLDLKEISYISWIDEGSSKKYLVAWLNNKLVGLSGTYTKINKKGICALCNRHEEVGMFLSEKKGAIKDTFTKKGNYICYDSHKCNLNLVEVDKLYDFIDRLKK